MPCDYSLYPADWPERRIRILKRAKNRCEECGLPNNRLVFRCCEKARRSIHLNYPGKVVFIGDAWLPPRLTKPAGKWMVGEGFSEVLPGKLGVFITGMAFNAAIRDWKFKPVRIILTIAHLDRTGPPGPGDGPLDCPDDRLKSLCQRCHLRLDAKRHAAKAVQTRLQRRAVGSLWEALPREGEVPHEITTCT